MSNQEATPVGGYARGVQSLLEGERLLGVAVAAEIVGGANPGEKRDMGSVVSLRGGGRDLWREGAFVWVFLGGRIVERK